MTVVGLRIEVVEERCQSARISNDVLVVTGVSGPRPGGASLVIVMPALATEL